MPNPNGRALFLKSPHFSELFVTATEKLVGRNLFEVSQSADNGILEVIGGLDRIVMRAAEGLWNNPVDDSELEKFGSVQLERFGRFRGVFTVFPKNGGTALGTDHGIVGVLKH